MHECVPTPAASEARAIELAKQLAAKPREALRWTKAWLNELAPWPAATRGLGVSLSLVGGEEEREMLPKAWAKREGNKS